MIEIKITGDTVDDVNVALKSLGGPNAKTMPLDDLLIVAKERFGVAGFAVEVKAIVGEPQGVPLPASPTDPTPAEVETVAKAPAAKAKKTPAKKLAEDASAALAAADKTFVVDEMVKRFGDPRQKLKAKAFIDVVTGRHGGVRLSLLDPALFPDIRAEMEAEFNIPKAANGNGAGEAHA